MLMTGATNMMIRSDGSRGQTEGPEVNAYGHVVGIGTGGALLCWSSHCCCVARSEGDDRIDDVMYQDPAFPASNDAGRIFRGLKPLWLEALDRPESELQRMAADTIALAHRSGMSGLTDTADKLIELFNGQTWNRPFDTRSRRAIVTLDASHADEVFAGRWRPAAWKSR